MLISSHSVSLCQWDNIEGTWCEETSSLTSSQSQQSTFELSLCRYGALYLICSRGICQPNLLLRIHSSVSVFYTIDASVMFLLSGVCTGFYVVNWYYIIFSLSDFLRAWFAQPCNLCRAVQSTDTLHFFFMDSQSLSRPTTISSGGTWWNTDLCGSWAVWAAIHFLSFR